LDYRLYSEADRARPEEILSFRALGLELAKIGTLLGLKDEGPAGVSEANYRTLRAAFEANAPAEHRRLLRPVLEYDWIPDWRCTMLFSVSGWMAPLVRRRFSPRGFDGFIATRKRQLEEYFAKA
jgi:DNA-binding transcriptional MerR regulator